MSEQTTEVTAQDTTKAVSTESKAAESAVVNASVDSNSRIEDKMYMKADESVKKDESTVSKETESKSVVPEKYELKLQEGSLLDSSVVEKISSYAKEKGLSNEQAQELLDTQEEAVSSFRDSQLQKLQDMRKTWVEGIKSDKEFGGERFNESAELARRVITKYADKELIDALNTTGYGDHPALFKFVAKLGRELKVLDDKLVQPKAHAKGDVDVVEMLYGKTE